MLEALLSERWSSTGQSPVRVVELSEQHVDASVMEDLLTYLYTGSVTLSEENVFSLCAASHYLQLPKLSSLSEHYLARLISTDNVLTLLQSATDRKFTRVQKRCCQFIVEFNESFNSFDTEQFYCLPPEAFRKFILSLKADIEVSILSYGSKLKRCLLYCVIHWVGRRTSGQYSDLIRSVTIPQEPKIRRIDSEQVFTIGGIDFNTKTVVALFECFNPLTGESARLPPMSTPRYDSTATVIDTKIYVIGGRTVDHQPTQSAEVFDCETMYWRTLNPVPEVLENLSSASLEDSIYVCGNRKLNNAGVLYRYSTTSGLWQPLGPIISGPYGTWRHEIVQLNGILYALTKGSSRARKYHPSNGQWSIVDEWDMLSSEDTFSVVFNGKLYQRDRYSQKTYCNRTNTFRKHPLPDNACRIHQTKPVVFQDRLLLLGLPCQSSSCFVSTQCKVWQICGGITKRLGYLSFNQRNFSIVSCEIKKSNL